MSPPIAWSALTLNKSELDIIDCALQSNDGSISEAPSHAISEPATDTLILKCVAIITSISWPIRLTLVCYKNID